MKNSQIIDEKSIITRIRIRHMYNENCIKHTKYTKKPSL